MTWKISINWTDIFIWILINIFLNIKNIALYLIVKNASFNYANEKHATYCNNHKLENMVMLKN